MLDVALVNSGLWSCWGTVLINKFPLIVFLCVLLFYFLPLLTLSVSARGVSYLFDIQVKTFNSVYDGEDVIGQARTGTGKTFSFAIPLVEKLQKDSVEMTRGRAPKVNTHSHPSLKTSVRQDPSISCTLSMFVFNWVSSLSFGRSWCWLPPESWLSRLLKTLKTYPKGWLLLVSMEAAHTTHKVSLVQKS